MLNFREKENQIPEEFKKIADDFSKKGFVCVESYIGEVGGNEGAKLEDQYLVTDKGLKLLSSIPLNLV